MSPARGATRAARTVAIVLLLAASGPASAQAPDRPVRIVTRPVQVDPNAGRVLLLDAPPSSDVVWSQRPIPPLTNTLIVRVQRAVALRMSGLVERSRDSLAVALRAAPHHPVIVTELVRTHIARDDFAAAERVARAERLATRDSALAARELAFACERLGRPGDALRTVVEAWTVLPAESEWAVQTILRLAGTDPRAAREALHAATLRSPGRADLARGEALVLSRLGQPVEAARAIAAAERPGRRPPLRLQFGGDLLASGQPGDSASAVETLVSLAADERAELTFRLGSARRAWDVESARGRDANAAPRLRRALADVPASRWGGDLVLGIARGLREAGQTAEARALLKGDNGLAAQMPELALEQVLADLRDGEPARAIPALDSLAGRWPEARWHLAEAQFWSGDLDSALANYGRVAQQTDGRWAGAALERTYLLEEAPGSPGLRMLGRIAWEDWRGAHDRARTLTDSLFVALGRPDPLYARTALLLADQRVAAGDVRAALAPLLAVADSLPDDRLAPLARQRAGDAYLRLHDETAALSQYEECLARYPRAWNAPEVRRRVEQLRRDRRF